MNISWVLADDLILDRKINIDIVRRTGPLWGSWKTWAGYRTDNVICHDMRKASELIKREFNRECNFYVPNSVYSSLGRPAGVKAYEGDFMGFDCDNQDEIVALHLASSTSDIVLLLGFDWSQQDILEDKLLEVKARNRRGLIHQAIKSHNQTQYILVEHDQDVMKDLAELENLDKDTFMNVLTVLRS